MKKDILFNLPIQFTQEEDFIVAYCSALELVTQGKTLDEARKNFDEVLSIFIEDNYDPKILEKTLLECGWKNLNNTISPPQVVANINYPISFPAYSFSE